MPCVCAYEMCLNLMQFGFNSCIFACTGVLIDICINIVYFDLNYDFIYHISTKRNEKLNRSNLVVCFVYMCACAYAFANVEQSRQIDRIEESLFLFLLFVVVAVQNCNAPLFCALIRTSFKLPIAKNQSTIVQFCHFLPVAYFSISIDFFCTLSVASNKFIMEKMRIQFKPSFRETKRKKQRYTEF